MDLCSDDLWGNLDIVRLEVVVREMSIGVRRTGLWFRRTGLWFRRTGVMGLLLVL